MRVLIVLLAALAGGCSGHEAESAIGPQAAQVAASTAIEVSIASGATASDITASSYYKERVFTKSDLMVGGKQMDDPLRHGLVYYLAPSWLLWNNPANYGKQSGLLLSKDGGKTWQVFSRQFDYKVFYVHPLTGEFFAIIGTQWQKPGEDGFLQNCSADKIIRSADGKKWKDITRGPGYVADLTAIFQDPDHPKRICAYGGAIRPYVFQSVDDEYTNWNWIRGDVWPRTHAETGSAK